MSRGFIWFDAGTPLSLMRAASFVESVESRQGIKIACLEEIAFRQGFISRSQLLEGAAKLDNDYGRYLEACAR